MWHRDHQHLLTFRRTVAATLLGLLGTWREILLSSETSDITSQKTRSFEINTLSILPLVSCLPALLCVFSFILYSSSTTTPRAKLPWMLVMTILQPSHFWNRPSSAMLRGVGWFGTDVSGLRIGPIFNSQAVLLGQRDPSIWDRHVVPKRRR